MSNLLHLDPAVQPGLIRLATWLEDESYSGEAIYAIMEYVRVEGTLAGAPGLDPADEEGAEHAFCHGLEPNNGVCGPYGEPDDTDGVWTSSGPDLTLDALAWALVRLEKAVPDLEDTDPELTVSLPPVTGGSPDPKSPEAIREWYREQEATGGFQGWLERNGGER